MCDLIDLNLKWTTGTCPRKYEVSVDAVGCSGKSDWMTSPSLQPAMIVDHFKGFQWMQETGDGTLMNPIGWMDSSGSLLTSWWMKIVESSDAETKIVPRGLMDTFLIGLQWHLTAWTSCSCSFIGALWSKVITRTTPSAKPMIRTAPVWSSETGTQMKSPPAAKNWWWKTSFLST